MLKLTDCAQQHTQEHEYKLKLNLLRGGGQGSCGSFGHHVSLHVCFQTVTLREGFVTHGTLVWSLPIVGPHVDRQVCFTSACFPTSSTHKWLVARVDSHVIVQMKLSLEGPATVRAAVRCLPCVDPHMNGQRSSGGEPLAALGAAIRLLVGMRPQVDLQLLVGQEHFAADVAEVRPLSVRVDLLMLPQRPGEFETPPTDPTAVWSLLRVGHLVAG